MKTKERPILFNGEMVRAILDGRKTQTRRVVKGCGDYQNHRSKEGRHFFHDGNGNGIHYEECPFGSPGDRLWVRETFQAFDTHPPSGDKQIVYRADGKGYGEYGPDEIIWSPSIHMPRWACRIVLEITDARLERLADITEEDTKAEGCTAIFGYKWHSFEEQEADIPMHDHTSKDHFAALWESINGEGSWDVNPWVWVIEFKVIQS